MLIVCEGENTETQYFEQLARFHRRSSLVDIAGEHDKSIRAVRIAKKLKAQAIADAKRLGNPTLKYDAVWCVFDLDEHPMVSEALEMASKNDIGIALSNPCFELWLLLHFRDYPGMQDRHQMKFMLKAHLPDYDKNIDFEAYKNGYEKAVERAIKLDTLAESVGEPGRNPTTGVHRLTGEIVPKMLQDKEKKPPRSRGSRS